MAAFDSVLVANRGEIALRIICCARAQGYRTVAVYSAADAAAPHVALADDAVCIGPPPVQESYLDAARILQAAAATGAQAVHPGYGFLSENAAFAQACRDAGLVFIGPAPAAIRAMGNKAEAKRLMLAAGVPCVPGYQDEDQSDAAMLAAAQSLGVPLMVKAAAGGGGRGMRLVKDLDDLPAALASARSEAGNAFGSAELILEKAVLRPRHVEVQVFGDSHGNVIHLGERDCSVQRRHQKVVEEAPCPVMTPTLRAAMGAAAVAAARSIDYAGAGTVEFLLDADGHFYFLEMNTRLQVEHPVTEMVTGLNLVALQLQIAQGDPLPVSQEDVALNGHAIEVRLYAENVAGGFLPASGRALRWQLPEGEGIRVDSGLAEGQLVSPFYDPMLAKIIAHGHSREAARRRLVRALKSTVLFGVESNREFLVDVLELADFAAGDATTALIADAWPGGITAPPPMLDHVLLAACLQFRQAQQASSRQMLAPVAGLQGFSSGRAIASRFCYEVDESAVYEPLVQQTADASYAVVNAGVMYPVRWLADTGAGAARVCIGERQLACEYAFTADGQVAVQLAGRAAVLTNSLAANAGAAAAAGDGTVTAPMHGNVLSVAVAVGEQVAQGAVLAVLEAMKMEHRLVAEIAGEVTAVHVAAGAQIAAGAVMLEISPTTA